MAEDQSYANPRFGAVKELAIEVVGADAGAADELKRFRLFTRAKVLECRAVVGRIVGKADTSAITVLKGTASIGAIVIGTSTEGSIVDASLTDTIFASTEDIVFTNVVATDTFNALIITRYQDLFSG